MGRSPRFWFVVALLTALLVVAGCGSGANEASVVGAKADILTVVSSFEPTTWDPSISMSMEIAFMGNMYETLIRANPPGSPELFSPLLATEWSVADDGLSWTFKLRQGVKFHDGADFNADAVKSSIERTIKIDQGAAYIWGALKEIEVVDPYTVKFVLNTPVPLDRMVASGYAAWMISPKNQGTKWFEQGHDAGTGPYTLESYQPKEQATFARFEGYWGGWKDNQYKKIVNTYAREETTAQQMLQGGEVDVAMSLSQDTAEALKSSPDINVQTAASTYLNYFIWLNVQRKPLDNKFVRQALSYATPYEDIIKVCENGQATQAHGPIPATLWPSDPSLPMYTYDLAKAKQLLAQAGYPNGFKLVMTTNANRPTEAQAATLMKESFKKIGVDLTVRPIPWPQQWALAKGPAAKRQDMLNICWWPGWPNGYDTLATCFVQEKQPAWNLSYWYSPAFDKLIGDAEARSGTDPEKAKSMFLQAQKMLIDEAVAIYLYDAKSVLASLKTVKGVNSNPNYQFVLFWYNVTPS